MAYTIENGMWRSVFAVPSDIVDSHLKLLGEVQLKVLLALLRCNGELGLSALAAIVGKSEQIVGEAVDSLYETGILGETQTAPALTYVEVADTPPPEPPSAERKITRISHGRPKLGRDEINEIAEKNEAVAWLLQEAQQVFGNTLRASETEALVALYTYYHMQPDLIMMVLQFCKSIDKLSMRYIETVAASWVDSEITTHEQAEREINRMMQARTYEGKIKSAFGIRDRALVTNEKKYIPVWFEDYGFDIQIITLAYERAVEAKGKLSFPYINGILSKWHQKGINTPADALRDSNAGSPYKKQATANGQGTSYDLGELEALLNKGEL